MFQKKKTNKKKTNSDSLSRNAWRKFRKDKLALFGAFVLIVAVVISIFGSLLRPDKTEDVVQTVSNIELQSPGFKATILKERLDQEVEKASFFDQMFFGGKQKAYKNYAINDDYEFDGAYIRFTEFNDRGVESTIKVKHMAQILYPLEFDNTFKDDDENSSFVVIGQGRVTRSIKDMQAEIEADYIFERTYWLGTAKQGRDMLSLIMASIIVSISVGFIALFISLTIGVGLGAISGYYRGRVDDIVMYFINVIWSVPALLVVIALSIALGLGFQTVCIAIGLTLWVDIARIVRGQVLSVREKEFVEASRALGYRSFRIIFRHVLPNIVGPLIVVSAQIFASAILMEAGLSFLGIGTQPPQPSLGAIVSEYKDYITNDGQAYLAILPGITIVILVLVFMLIGNGVRDALDSKTN